MNLYVDPSLGSLTPGQQGVWNGGRPGRRGVIVGQNGFETLAAALAVATTWSTIWLSEDEHLAPTAISGKQCMIRGRGSTLNQSDPLVVSNASVIFRDVRFRAQSMPIDEHVRASGPQARVGLTHCNFRGRVIRATHATQEGAIVLVGCDFNMGQITSGVRVLNTQQGASAVVQKTPMTTAGASGRSGNWFRHCMRIEAPAESRDVTKGQKAVWVPVDIVFGSIEPLRAREYYESRLAAADVTHRIDLPIGLTITSAFRVVHRDRYYMLGPAMTVDDRHARITFMALERAS